jgi:hypothetical protein
MSVVPWYTSMIRPVVSVNRIGMPEPVMNPGRSWIQDPGQ